MSDPHDSPYFPYYDVNIYLLTYADGDTASVAAQRFTTHADGSLTFANTRDGKHWEQFLGIAAGVWRSVQKDGCAIHALPREQI